MTREEQLALKYAHPPHLKAQIDAMHNLIGALIGPVFDAETTFEVGIAMACIAANGIATRYGEVLFTDGIKAAELEKLHAAVDRLFPFYAAVSDTVIDDRAAE